MRLFVALFKICSILPQKVLENLDYICRGWYDKNKFEEFLHKESSPYAGNMRMFDGSSKLCKSLQAFCEHLHVV